MSSPESSIPPHVTNELPKLIRALQAQAVATLAAAIISRMQRPISINCITVPVGRPLWKDIPSWFLLAEDDRMIVPETQRYMAERMKAKIKAHPVDHTPSVTAPAVAAITNSACRAIQRRRETQEPSHKAK